MPKKKIEIKWLSEPEEHDYLAAKSYLSFIYDESKANAYVGEIESEAPYQSSRQRTFSGHPVCRCWESATCTSKKINRK